MPRAHSSWFRRAPIALAALAILASRPAHAARIGGTDVVIAVDPEMAGGSTHDLAIASDGTLFAAVQVNPPSLFTKINIYRSTNGGHDWQLWGTVEPPMPSIGNAQQPSLCIAEGNVNRLYIAFRQILLVNQGFIRVCSTPLQTFTPTYTTVMTSGSVDFERPDIVSSADETGAYKLYVAAIGKDADGGDVWFSRSSDFNVSWTTAFKVREGTGGNQVSDARIGYGRNGHVYVGYSFDFAPPQTFDDNVVVAKSTVADGGTSDGDWIAAYQFALSGGQGHVLQSLSTGHVSDEVLLGIKREGASISVLADGDGVLDTYFPHLPEITPAVATQVHVLPGHLGFRAASLDPNGLIGLRRSDGPGDPWSLVDVFSDTPFDTSTLGSRPAADDDPMHQFRMGVAWESFHASGDDTLWFDAEWLSDPGFPNLLAPFPVHVAYEPVSAPAITNVDADPFEEIVFTDENGGVQVLNHDGTLATGWPVALPGSSGGSVAIGDLDGDGDVELTVGSSNTGLQAFHANGTSLTGFPKNLGGDPAFVSIGTGLAGPGRQIVAVAGKSVHVLRFNGTEAPGFPVALPILSNDVFTRAAAIGDVDADGQLEIVVVIGRALGVIGPNGGIEELLEVLGSGDSWSAQPSLADFDLDGDLEIAAPTVDGMVYVLNHDGSTYSGFWPFYDPSGLPITPIALAQIRGTLRPELVFASHSGRGHLLFDSGTEASDWPIRIGASGTVFGGPIVESADADWRDVFYGTGELLAVGLHDDGSDLGGWPARIPTPQFLTPASGDLDGDGLVDIVMLSAGDVTVFSTGAPLQRTLALGQWPMEGHDPQRTGCLCSTEGVTAVADRAPASTNRLAPPVPHPARAGQPVRLRFSLAEASRVTLVLFDISGRRAARLVDGNMTAGEHVTTWDTRLEGGGNAPPGVYLARLEVQSALGRGESSRPVLILR